MKKLIGFKLAGDLLLILLLLLFVMHILILTGILPYEFVWGGQIADASDLIRFESMALILTAAFIFIILMKTGYIKTEKFRKLIYIGVWLVFAYFLLNIFGNLASGVSLEKLIFTPVTIILTFLALRLAIEK